jgi:hypothetical protein
MELVPLTWCYQIDVLDWQKCFQGGGCAMGRYNRLTPEERARITEIQDSLIDLYVEQKEALEEGRKARAIELVFEIKELRDEIEKIKDWASV